MEQNQKSKLIGITSNNSIDREKVTKFVASYMGIRIGDFDEPIMEFLRKLILFPTLQKGDGSMKSYLGKEWSYQIQEKFVEDGKVTFKPVRYYLTPHAIFTRLKYDMRVIHADIWVNLFFNSQTSNNTVIPVRYPNEADAILARGGVLIRVENSNSTSPVSREDALMDNYPCTYQIDLENPKLTQILDSLVK